MRPTLSDIRVIALHIVSAAILAVVGLVWRSVPATIAVLVFALIVAIILINVMRVRHQALNAELLTTKTELEALQAFSEWHEVTDCTGLSGFQKALEKSDMHPKEALHDIGRSLDFMGNGASKWSRQAQDMKAMLKRFEDFGEGGEARMLVLNPLGEVLAANAPAKEKVLRSLVAFDDLRRHHPSLHVKLYDHRPTFRITIIDGDSAVIGHYRNYQADSKDTPLLIFTRGKPWSFFSPFKLLFDYEWNRAEDVDWDAIRREAKDLD